MAILDTVIHKWLGTPYSLHVHFDKNVKQPRGTVLFLHGIGNSGAAWNEVAERLPADVRLISIDLLGFGESKNPQWAKYSAKTQAKSVVATFLKLRIREPVIIIGHSMGALVAVEVARRFPLLVRSLVLCSPPFYRPLQGGLSIEKVLHDLYQLVRKHPYHFVKVAQLAKQLGFINNSFSLTRHNTSTYMNALEASIINQTALIDATKLRVPTTILYGRLDPVVISANLRFLAQENPHIHLKSILASHEIMGEPYIKAVTDTLSLHLKPQSKV